jgi:hypothetical protein
MTPLPPAFRTVICSVSATASSASQPRSCASARSATIDLQALRGSPPANSFSQARHRPGAGTVRRDTPGWATPSACGADCGSHGGSRRRDRGVPRSGCGRGTSLGHTALEMSMLTFDVAVLMRHSGIVAGRRHLVVRAQRLVAPRMVDPGIVIEIAERGGETVGAVLSRHAAERPKGVLQADGKRGETLRPAPARHAPRLSKPARSDTADDPASGRRC